MMTSPLVVKRGHERGCRRAPRPASPLSPPNRREEASFAKEKSLFSRSPKKPVKSGTSDRPAVAIVAMFVVGIDDHRDGDDRSSWWGATMMAVGHGDDRDKEEGR